MRHTDVPPKSVTSVTDFEARAFGELSRAVKITFSPQRALAYRDVGGRAASGTSRRDESRRDSFRASLKYQAVKNFA